MPFWVCLLLAAWNTDVLAGAPEALLVHKVILSLEARARMVEQKSRENPWVLVATELSWLPWTAYVQLLLCEKETNRSPLSHYSFGCSVICRQS